MKASAILVPICLGAAVALHLSTRDGSTVPVPLLIVAVLVGMIPILLLILSDAVSVEAGPTGVKVDFASMQAAAEKDPARARPFLADNLGVPSPVQDHHRDTIIDTLRGAVGRPASNGVVVVDLGEGKSWWKTRLLLLAAGAAHLGYPQAIVFTSITPDQPRQFIGWTHPSDLLRRLIEKEPTLRDAYESAQHDLLIWQLSKVPGQPGRTPPFSVPGGLPLLPPDGDFEPERLLLNQIEILERINPPLPLTRVDLEADIGSVLHTHQVDRDADQDHWAKTVTNSTADFFAVTSNGEFLNLLSRRAAINAVLSSIIRQSPAG